MSHIKLTQNQRKKIGAYVYSNQDLLPQKKVLKTFELNTTPFTIQLNSILRANLATVNIEKFLNDFDNAFNQYQTTEPITVYRVFNYQEMLRYLMNNSYLDLGYMSTSKDIENTQRFYEKPKVGYFPAFLTINIPVGTNILVLDNIYNFDNVTYENEILIKRKACFDVIIDKEIESNGLEEIIGKININFFQTIRVLELNFVRYLS